MLAVFFMMIFTNCVIILNYFSVPVWLGVVCGLLSAAGFVAFNIRPVHGKGVSVRLTALAGGCELVRCGAVCGAIETVGYLVLCLGTGAQLFSVAVLWTNGIVAVVLLLLLLLNGCLRIFLLSAQLGLIRRVLLVLLWWIPIVNLALLWKCRRIAYREYRTEVEKQELDHQRKENEVCKTKYPILLVHGVFFRDWQYFNYWGRIPRELIKNGAIVYYGNQQSADAIENSAAELKAQIEKIVAETNCDKVNIIAHSKGGLDSRFAISCLGMANHVASLTTINTPHRGCVFVDKLLKNFPHKLILALSQKYNKTFTKLGDQNPDFYSAVNALTAESCALFNAQVADVDGVWYSSVSSKMKGFASFGPPLCFVYPFIRHYEGENDGLVAVRSANWGEYQGMLAASGRRGISHGDMIDLMRENIKGFDVREFYVELVKSLKERGL